MRDMILIIDFGSQYTQLIARRVREHSTYCEIYPWDKCPEITENVKGVILSGSPFSVKDENSPQFDLSGIQRKVPLLGICFGAQYIAYKNGGVVSNAEKREYGKANLANVDSNNVLLEGVKSGSQVWMSHGDTIESLPAGFKNIAGTENISNAAFFIQGEETYGLQFHPEVFHSLDGGTIISNFITKIAKCPQNWTPDVFVDKSVQELKAQLGDDRVILALSGGVDSSVTAAILQKAIGDNLYCIFVNHGLLRKNEFNEVLESYEHMGLNVKGVDASQQFYNALKGITDPEHKRKTIGKIFVDVFDQESKLVENAKWLGQGTIYPDVIESVSTTGGPSKTIKSHHNVGGLPDYMKLKVVEPLKMLFKDEVRRVGKSMGVPQNILGRHPFPGPGLGIRILGEITPERVKVLQEADAVYISELRASGWYDKIWQAGAILLPVNTVGVMGDERTYENAVALRAVSSIDGMTADWCHIPYEILGKVSNRIINEVKGINRVTYDISSKPPATIEWE
ncbi:MAG: glutamine-hydrolyzing GMP synthase [Brumimicrobium sp.]|nr:glutamine-hydrolyzing GMP synthase [Brumimicrobium sp.]MCO5269287.1 glutamine-hydrolyzing GMP synthase [Brumimicrobium sp.]